eukprot:6196563-Pleurochrysis_carterae.AAC.1
MLMPMPMLMLTPMPKLMLIVSAKLLAAWATPPLRAERQRQRAQTAVASAQLWRRRSRRASLHRAALKRLTPHRRPVAVEMALAPVMTKKSSVGGILGVAPAVGGVKWVRMKV